jgi:hypothetical protein
MVSSRQLAFFSQINPVSLSVTVPSPLPVKRGEGQAAPFWMLPSSPGVYPTIWPVLGNCTATGFGSDAFELDPEPQAEQTSADTRMAMSIFMLSLGRQFIFLITIAPMLFCLTSITSGLAAKCPMPYHHIRQRIR